MQAVRQADALARAGERLHLAIGVFDGVHLGHQAVLREAVESAGRGSAGAVAAMVTFEPHPARVLAPDHAPPLLTTTGRKLSLAARLGIERALVLPFTRQLAALAPDAFIDRLDGGAGRLASITVGSDWRFGADRAGDVATLGELGRARGFDVRAVAPVMEGDSEVRSSRIREAILGGDLALAETLLARPFDYEGTVEQGRQLGRRLGFPTANLPVASDRVIPPAGVYAIEARLGGHGEAWIGGVANLGHRPTVEGGAAEPLLEVHLIGWSGDCYGALLHVRFRAFLRPERKFADLDALRRQIGRDRSDAEARLAGPARPGPSGDR